MSFIRKIVLSLSLLAILSTACQDSFLERLPTGSLSEAQLTSQDGLEGVLIAAYAILGGRDGFYSSSGNWYWGTVRGGDANKGSNAGDQSQMIEVMLYNPQPTNGSIYQKYQRLYEGIARANATIRLAGLADESVDAAVVSRIVAEARFLRGHYYFEMKTIYDDVPYVDETWDEVTPIPNDQDLWQFIDADFAAAFADLPATQGDAGRANRWAARAYQGKAFLFQGRYAEAKTAFDDVVANGQTASGETYALLPNYGDLFLAANDNHAESVFAIQAAAGTGTIANANPGEVLNFPHGSTGPARPGGCCGFNQPSLDLANSFRTVGGLPLLDGSYNTGANQLVTDLGLSSGDAFTPDAGELDPRIDHSLGRRGIPYYDWGPHPGFDWIRDQAYGGPYSPKKYVYTNGGGDNDNTSWTPGYSTINQTIIRFADVLLMLAEAEVELNNLEAARTLVNQVRARAQSSFLMDGGNAAANYVINQYNTAWTDQATARSAVQFERKLELSGEGKRFFDIQRWHMNGTADAAAILNAYLAYEIQFLPNTFTGGSFDNSVDLYLPIPQAELDIQNSEGSTVITQNPGY